MTNVKICTWTINSGSKSLSFTFHASLITTTCCHCHQYEHHNINSITLKSHNRSQKGVVCDSTINMYCHIILSHHFTYSNFSRIFHIISFADLFVCHKCVNVKLMMMPKPMPLKMLLGAMPKKPKRHRLLFLWVFFLLLKYSFGDSLVYK